MYGIEISFWMRNGKTFLNHILISVYTPLQPVGPKRVKKDLWTKNTEARVRFIILGVHLPFTMYYNMVWRVICLIHLKQFRTTFKRIPHLNLRVSKNCGPSCIILCNTQGETKKSKKFLTISTSYWMADHYDFYVFRRLYVWQPTPQDEYQLPSQQQCLECRWLCTVDSCFSPQLVTDLPKDLCAVSEKLKYYHQHYLCLFFNR